MSHTAEIRVKLENINIEALKEAVKAAFRAVLNQDIEVREGGYVTDYYGRKTKCDLVIPFVGPGKARNIGFKIEEGELKMIYEDMMLRSDVANRLLNTIRDAYITYMTASALKSMGYNIKIDYENDTFQIIAEKVM